MNWEQKLDALQAIAETHLRMRSIGSWYVSSQMEIGGDSFLRGSYGDGSTPENAVLDHWSKYVDQLDPDLFVVTGGNSDDSKCWRWNGYRWVDITALKRPKPEPEPKPEVVAEPIETRLSQPIVWACIKCGSLTEIRWTIGRQLGFGPGQTPPY